MQTIVCYRTLVLTRCVAATRRCPRCVEFRSLEDFNRSTKLGYQGYCRDCQRAWYLENRAEHQANVNANTDRYRKRNADLVLEYLRTHPCADCGEADPLVLEFDHVRDKDQAVSRLKSSGAPPRLMAEIDKCEVRCVNCHLKRTATQFGWRKARNET